MANRYWVGGTGTWDTTTTTNWSASTGGASGASVPTAADSVFFDQAGTYTVTCTGALACLDITVSAGTVTFAQGTSPTLDVRGSMLLLAGTVWNMGGTLTFSSTTTGRTVTTNGVTINASSTRFFGTGGGWTLGSALTLGYSQGLTVVEGSFNTGNYNVTCGPFTISGTSTRSVTLGSSTISIGNGNTGGTWIATTVTGLTFSAGTSTITTAQSTFTFTGGGLTYNNLSITSGGSAKSIGGANTFNNLTVAAPSSAGVTPVTFAANQTINGTLSTTGTAGNQRVFFASATYGIGYTLTVNSAASLTDADFRDIYVIGTAAPISGTRIGNRGNCSGITFSTPKTVYWNLAGAQNWSADGWCAASGGSPSTDNFPLPQDTAIFDNTGSVTGTITFNTAIAYVGSVNMSARTTAMTLGVSNATTVYGNWTNGSGTTISGASTLTFSGGTTQTITSAGKTYPCQFNIDSYGGTVQAADAFNTGNLYNFTVTNGTFNTAGYAFTCGFLLASGTGVKAISFGASTVTVNSGLSIAATSNTTLNAGTSTILVAFNGGVNLNFGITNPYNLSIVPSGIASTLGITSSGTTFNNFSVTPPAFDGITTVTYSGNVTINGTLTCAGASVMRRVFVRSNTIGTQRTLTAAAISADDCDFRDIVVAGTAAGSSPTRAGDCGNNSGITFPASKTVYWNLAGTQNWSATAWCTASGGTPAGNNFPLAQDIAVFDNAGSAGTVTIDAIWNIGTFDSSLRTSAITFSSSTLSPVVYGDWKFGTGVTSSSTTGVITFSKNGIQTITSNGIQFNCPITINNPLANVKLADALSLGATITLTLTGGTFDAVSYNVTIGAFSNGSTSNTVKMGSGTWTLSGTGTVWDFTTVPAELIAGTSNIVLSDTSTNARTFNGGSLYYNKLTIGGATGISTLTINGSNTFGELASTKTVAHTILFQNGIYTFGKWSVTGTVGNVVTITGTAGVFNVIAGPAVSGINYLAMVTWGISTTSPGEFYAGSNSTGTATAPVFRTPAPTPRTLYWRGGTGNWSATTSWSTISGGAGPANIPTSRDSVIFNSASNATAYTATIDAGVTIARCAAFTMAGPASGNVTFDGTVPIAYHGNVSFAATGITRSYQGIMNLVGNSSYTFTTNGLTLSSQLVVTGIGSTWTLGSALNIGVRNVVVTYGSFSTSASNYALTVTNLNSNGVSSSGQSNSNIRSMSLNGSTITISSVSPIVFTTATNLTFNAGTSTISCNLLSGTFNGGGQTFYNVSFIDPTNFSSLTVTGVNTFNNLTFTGNTNIAIRKVIFSANQTINGTLTLGAGTAAAYRMFLTSNTIGTPRTLTINALAAGAADYDFRDITVTGAAAPLTGTRFGDAKGNSGITFPAAKTVYYGQTGSNSWAVSGSGSWSATSGGALDGTMFPLAQDTAVFPAATYPASGLTTTINDDYNIGTIDMSLRTSNTMTLATGSTIPQIYGNWINGTGTTLTGTGQMTFAGRTTQTITSSGVTFTQPITVDSVGGSVSLQDAAIFNISSATVIALTTGTFNANGYNLTLSNAGTSGLSVSGTSTRTFAFGSGTTTLAGAGLTWDATTTTNLTVTGTGTISLTSASGKSFSGGFNYSGITLNQGGIGTLTISGSNIFANITKTAVGATTISLGNTTQTVGAFTAAGTASNLLTITGTSAASPATLIYSGSGVISNVDYVVPTFVRAYPTTSTWYAGANSTNGGSLGWVFAAYVPPSSGQNSNFFGFF
jgi:hypothetical protein